MSMEGTYYRAAGQGPPEVNQMEPWPKAIFFDVGETLVRPRRPYDELLEEVSHTLGLDLQADLVSGLATRIDRRVADRARQMLPFTFPAEASQQFWFDTYHGFFIGFLSGRDAHRLAQGLLELLSAPAGYMLYEDAIPTLEQLRADGHRLGIISNWEAWLPTLLEEYDLAPFFQHIVISGLCGMEKPDSRIFTRALDEGGYQPAEVVYVGDRPAHDVEPVFTVGMRPILLDRTNRYSEGAPCQRIGSLNELPMALHVSSRKVT